MSTEDSAIPVGTAVRIAATRPVGSARALDGLTGVIVAHHWARGWCFLKLDANGVTGVTEHANWSAPFESLAAIEAQGASR